MLPLSSIPTLDHSETLTAVAVRLDLDAQAISFVLEQLHELEMLTAFADLLKK
jgi:hypothetical protein